MTGHVVGIDGGGTTTTLAIADTTGSELLRRVGPAALVEPGDPAASAAVLVPLIRDAAADAGLTLPLAALCAGLAGAGTDAARAGVRDALADAGVADVVDVVGDGEIALEGALAGGPGVLLVAGTGSVAWARGEDGRVERCGGWGWRVGDEGSGYAIACAGLQAALHAADGRGPPTALLPELLGALGLAAPEEIPGRVGRAPKGEVAALAPRVIALAASGDAVAARIVDAATGDLLRHVCALVERLAPWSGTVPVVFHGGVFREAALARRLEERLSEIPIRLVRQPAAADAVTGAVGMARYGMRLAPFQGRSDQQSHHARRRTMTDEAKGKGRHVGGKIKEKAGEVLGDREMEREGELSQQQGRAEQDRDRAQEAERDARDREAAAKLEKERLKRKPGSDL